ITARDAASNRQPAFALLASVLVSLFVVLPWHAWQAHAFVKPYAAASATIAGADADVVVVDPTDIWYGSDLVRNDPFLRASPKVVTLAGLSEAQITDLCRRYELAVFDRNDAQRLGIKIVDTPAEFAEPYRKRRDLMRALGCGRPVGAGGS